MPDFSLERQRGEKSVVGVDEAGCGPWAGPVVAGAVTFHSYDLPSYLQSVLDDSKKMTALKREKAYQLLLQAQEEGVLSFASASVSVDEIDTLNIRQAALSAMAKAVTKLLEGGDSSYQRRPEGVAWSSLVDHVHLLVDGTGKPNLDHPMTLVIKGDAQSLSIAAASIIAKVERDQEMKRLASLFPGYGWEKNAGYGTKQHQTALDRLGVTPHHRKSFAPIRQRLRAS